MFFRDPGGNAGPSLYTIDLTGRNEQRVPTPGFASDPGLVAAAVVIVLTDARSTHPIFWAARPDRARCFPLREVAEPIFIGTPSCRPVNAPITIPIGLWWIGVSKWVRQGLIKVDKTFA